MRFQFSLRAILICVTLLACWLAEQFTAPMVMRFFIEMFLIIAMTGFLIPVIVYGRGNTHAFAIGALVPTAITLTECLLETPYWTQTDWEGLLETIVNQGGWFSGRVSIFWLPTSILLGIVSVCVRKALTKII